MSEGTQLTQGVWVFHDEASGLNSGAILAQTGAILVDPGSSPADLDALDRLVRDASREVLAVALTHAQAESLAPAHWPDARRVSALTTASHSEPLPLKGWEASPIPGSGSLAIYNAREGILFCGEILSGPHIPSVPDGADRYLESLESIETRTPKLLVPSYGEVAQGKRAIRERIERDRNYLHALARHIFSALQSGATLDRTLEVARTIYEDYPFIETHLDNVRSIWHELSGAGGPGSGVGDR